MNDLTDVSVIDELTGNAVRERSAGAGWKSVGCAEAQDEPTHGDESVEEFVVA